MQTQPKKFSQFLMTSIGLVLLAMALMLNHKHPRNEGIATLPHNSIYQLRLNAGQQTEQSFVAQALKTLAPRNKPESNAYTAPSTNVEAASTISAAPNLCASIDEQDYGSVVQNNQLTYAAYQASAHTTDDYRAYSTAVTKSFNNYQSLVSTSGCTPTHFLPLPSNT